MYRLGHRMIDGQLRAGVLTRVEPEQERHFITSQYALVYVLEGEGEYNLFSGRSFPIRAGCFFQRFPDVRHHIRLTAPVRRGFVGVPRYVWELLRLMGAARETQPVHYIGKDAAILERIHGFYQSLTNASDAQLLPILSDMFAFIVDLHGRTTDAAPNTPSEVVQQACELLSSQYSDTIRIPDLAHQLGMSNSVFRKRFLAEVGVAPGEYRIRRRLEKAMELLVSTDMQITEIAERLGYYNIYALSAQFKQFAGISPSEFRKRSR